MTAKPRTGKAGGTGARGAGGRTRAAPSSLPRIYEGPAVLTTLLGRAHARVDGAGAIERFVAAQADERLPSEVIPELFEGEPRFGGPDEAMRLFGNLLGLWELLEAGHDPAELQRAPPPDEPLDDESALDDAAPEPGGEGEALRGSIELPAAGSLASPPLTEAFVDPVWQHLADLPPRERGRRRHRHENVFSELAEFARTAELEGPGVETLASLCFELAEMFEHAFGARLGPVRYRALLAADPSRASALEPLAAAYVAGCLDEAEDDPEEPLDGPERVAVQQAAFAAIVVLHEAVRAAAGDAPAA